MVRLGEIFKDVIAEALDLRPIVKTVEVQTIVEVERRVFSIRAGVDAVIDGINQCGGKIGFGRSLTTLEKCLLGGLACYGASKLVNGSSIKRWWGKAKSAITGDKKRKVEVDAERIKGLRISESRRSNSEEEPMTPPKFQAKIGVFRDGRFVVIGCAVRLKHNVLVSPDHVIAEEPEEKFVMGHLPDKYVSLKGKELHVIATDLVALVMTENELSLLGLKEAKIGYVSRKTYCQIVGPIGKGTQGDLELDEVFGRVVYSATTVPGYSGAAYVSGSALMGIHQSGGKVNGGYAASYIWCLVREQILRQEPEGSEDWLMSQFDSGRELRWEANPTEPSMVRIQVNGEFSNVQRSSMKKSFGADWDDQRVIRRTDVKAKAKRAGYRDFDLESSGEYLLSSRHPGVLNSPAGNQAPQVLNHQSTIQELGVSKKQIAALRSFLSSFDMQSASTSGQVSQALPTK